jgi:hypothetical protein
MLNAHEIFSQPLRSMTQAQLAATAGVHDGLAEIGGGRGGKIPTTLLDVQQKRDRAG